MGFCVANTRKGNGRSKVLPPAETRYSCMDCSSAACVLGGVRLISSASSTLVKIGPRTKRKTRRPLVRSSSSTSEPVMSDGIMSGVNWTRPKDRSSVSARVRMSKVLARPGTPTNSPWPRAKSAMSRWSMTSCWPTMRLPISVTSCRRASASSRTRATSPPGARGSGRRGHRPVRQGKGIGHRQRMPRRGKVSKAELASWAWPPARAMGAGGAAGGADRPRDRPPEPPAATRHATRWAGTAGKSSHRPSPRCWGWWRHRCHLCQRPPWSCRRWPRRRPSRGCRRHQSVRPRPWHHRNRRCRSRSSPPCW